MTDALDAAIRVLDGLVDRAVPGSAGPSWPSAGIAEGDGSDGTLGWGPAGVALSLLRGYELLGDQRYLDAARGALATVRAAIDPEQPRGLYVGRAGLAYVLAEGFRVTGDSAYAAAALDVATGLETSGGPYDLYEGLAGVALVLLHLATALDEPALAVRATPALDEVLAAGEVRGPGIGWRGSLARPDMPNFAHGTAGIAYVLAVAARRTGRADLLAAAVAGGTYLRSIARTDRGGCEIALGSHEPESYWMSWCHGPTGTARLWAALHALTGDASWRACREGAVRSVLARVLPGGQVRGFGNATSLCCGSAGLLDFVVDVRDSNEDTETAARRLLAHVARHASADGRTWQEAGRVRTGWLAGAAGIGYALLRRGAAEHGLPVPAGIVDSPYAPPFAAIAEPASRSVAV